MDFPVTNLACLLIWPDLSPWTLIYLPFVCKSDVLVLDSLFLAVYVISASDLFTRWILCLWCLMSVSVLDWGFGRRIDELWNCLKEVDLDHVLRLDWKFVSVALAFPHELCDVGVLVPHCLFFPLLLCFLSLSQCPHVSCQCCMRPSFLPGQLRHLVLPLSHYYTTTSPQPVSFCCEEWGLRENIQLLLFSTA